MVSLACATTEKRRGLLTARSVRRAIRDGESSRGLPICEIREALHSLRPQRRSISGNRGLSRLFDARHSAVERRDQFAEVTRESSIRYRHAAAPLRVP